jgi:hypothetical protein
MPRELCAAGMVALAVRMLSASFSALGRVALFVGFIGARVGFVFNGLAHSQLWTLSDSSLTRTRSRPVGAAIVSTWQLDTLGTITVGHAFTKGGTVYGVDIVTTNETISTQRYPDRDEVAAFADTLRNRVEAAKNPRR